MFEEQMFQSWNYSLSIEEIGRQPIALVLEIISNLYQILENIEREKVIVKF